jgi:hypothetical protein
VVEALPSAAATGPAHAVGSGHGAWGLVTLGPFLTALGLLKRTSPEVRSKIPQDSRLDLDRGKHCMMKMGAHHQWAAD